MSYMTPNKIISDVIKYINDPTGNEAILIDGDWGMNKTSFIQNTLIDHVKKNIKRSHNKNRTVIYISLYKIECCNQISDELGINDEGVKLKINIKEHITKHNNIVSRMFKTGKNLLHTETSEFPGLSDYFKTLKTIIIFDDLSSCLISKDDLFTYINNLVEQNKIKAILVDNQLETEYSKKVVHLNKIVKCLEDTDPIRNVENSKDRNLTTENLKEKSDLEDSKITTELKKEISTKEISTNEINGCFKDTQNWGTDFHGYCKKYHNKIMSGNKFIVLINTDKLLEKIILSDTKNINEFNRGLDVIYSFSNLNDFFKDDEVTTRDLIKKLRMELIGDLRNSSDDKKAALDRTKNKLEESLKLICIK